jgi:hypothetical protein
VNKFVEYRRAMDDVRLWDPEMMGVLRTKDEIRVVVFEEKVFKRLV